MSRLRSPPIMAPDNICSVILVFRVLCNFVFPGVLSFSWPVRHFYFPLMKKKTKNYLRKMFPQGKFMAV